MRYKPENDLHAGSKLVDHSLRGVTQSGPSRHANE